MFPLTAKTVLIIVAVVIFIVIAIVIFYSCKQSPTYKLVRFGGLFRGASNLDIGHSLGAPICHARPWLNTDFNSGLQEYLGAITIPKDKSLYLKFPNKHSSYEVNVVQYPSWEHIGATIYRPTEICIGYNRHNNIILSKEDKKILIIVTWIKKIKEDTQWLNKCEVYFDKPPTSTLINKAVLPTITDEASKEEIEEAANQEVEEYIQNKDNYKITQEVISTINRDPFPPTLGISFSLTYTPSKANEIIFVVLPNRPYTGVYIEIGGKRTYLEDKSSSTGGIFVFELNSMETITIEEKILASPDSNILPLYLIVAEEGYPSSGGEEEEYPSEEE
jgi:type II secretory pathway pseudopilin PulG